MTADPAYSEWQRIALEREQRGEARVRAAVATVHYRDDADMCAHCRHPWPCKTADAVRLDSVLEDRERIARAVMKVGEGMPHRDLLRPTLMQVVSVIRRGGGR